MSSNIKKIVVYTSQDVNSAIEVAWNDMVFEPSANALWSTTNGRPRYSTTSAATVGDQRAYTWGQVAHLVAWFAEEAPVGTVLKAHWQIGKVFNLTSLLNGVAVADYYEINWTKI